VATATEAAVRKIIHNPEELAAYRDKLAKKRKKNTRTVRVFFFCFFANLSR